MDPLDKNVYLEIQEFIAAYPVVVILGPRQIWKTTLAKAVTKAKGEDAICLDLELPFDVQALEDA
jgi:predicted AAA+ superfamily ATPase